MGVLSNLTVTVLLISLSLLVASLHLLFRNEGRLVRSVHYDPNEVTAHKKPGSSSYYYYYYYPGVPKSDGPPESLQRSGTSWQTGCSVAPQSRFDCGRDRLLSQEECEERECCYAPLPGSAGPPWCFYPAPYPGYTMGRLTPSERGQTATLTRASPSYLPKDVSTLSLEAMDETPGCFHLVLKDPSSERYKVPLPAGRPQTEAFQDQDALYTTQYQHHPFGFVVRRKSSGRVL
uniref:P-type domain-containing protein n=1 Tax=Fundulus heteroclitus TaxID=8078 RepID=A0A3Q2TU39_FUNHE